MNERFVKRFQLEKQLYVDKSTMLYYGEHSAKQRIKGKPIKFSLQTLVSQYKLRLCNSMWTVPTQRWLGVIVVAKVIRKLPKDFSFKYTFNKLFTSINSLKMFTENGVGGTGTLRLNYTNVLSKIVSNWKEKSRNKLF